MKISYLKWVATFAAVVGFGYQVQAQNVYLNKGETEKVPTGFTLPYAFPSDTMDFAFGLGGASSGRPQPQSKVGWGLLGSSNGSYGAYLGGVDLQMPFLERLFVDPIAGFSRYDSMRSYQDLPGELDGFPGRAGSNESDLDDYIEGKGWDIFAEARFRFLLPIGFGKDTVINTYQLKDGLLGEGASGGESFNPLASGRSYLLLTPFYRSRKFDDDSDELLSASNGVVVGYEWDNRDFVATPSRGEHFTFKFTRDFGWFDSDGSYSTWDVEFSKYFSLPETSWARQQVIAFNFWTGDTPTWDESGDGSISGRAPAFRSPSLGGFTRLRANPFYRYNDRSAIFYSLEYRLIPEWNPWAKINWLNNWLAPKWWQIVPFAEVGRVAPEYDLGTLHDDMKWDAGISLRFMLKKSTVRVDWAASDEDNSFWVMFGQPF